MFLDELLALKKGDSLRLLHELEPFKKGRFFTIKREAVFSRSIDGAPQTFMESPFLTLAPEINPKLSWHFTDGIFRVGVKGSTCLYFEKACKEEIAAYYSKEEERREDMPVSWFNLS